MLSPQPQPALLPLPLAVLLRLRRQSPALSFLGPRALPLGLFRLPLNLPLPRGAEFLPIARLHEALGQLVQPGLVLASNARHGHASAAAGGADGSPGNTRGSTRTWTPRTGTSCNTRAR
jgi:hypothetical protein